MSIERKPVDTEGLERLIAKVKRGDADNASALSAHNVSVTAHDDIRKNIAAVDGKGLVVINGQLRFC